MRLVYKGNREEIVRMLYDNVPTSKDWYIAFPSEYKRSCMFIQEVNKAFPAVQWYGLCRKTNNPNRPIVTDPVAKVGNIYAFRNGWNLTKYNFVVCIDRTFHFRQNVGDTVLCMQLATMPREELPLLMGTQMKKLNKDLFEKLLKGGN